MYRRLRILNSELVLFYFSFENHFVPLMSELLSGGTNIQITLVPYCWFFAPCRLSAP
jgi:hypothetical protein